ncbi:uncharacterized protein LOC129910566 [Episyrphus balteatus]|uniref:uncharacterized protein LOC129910566 n=1 Tax=Episyrphus balteatus TaxID=286459 RepID=UPI0024851C9B|nr:uncharacterized protein LOC129910566 [Episyrphus balteatus]
MILFITAVYKGLSSIIKVQGQSSLLTYLELAKAVKDQFKIIGNIKFYDAKANVFICDEDVVEYAIQFKSSPSWTLGVLDDGVLEIPGSQGSSLSIRDSDTTVANSSSISYISVTPSPPPKHPSEIILQE